MRSSLHFAYELYATGHSKPTHPSQTCLAQVSQPIVALSLGFFLAPAFSDGILLLSVLPPFVGPSLFVQRVLPSDTAANSGLAAVATLFTVGSASLVFALTAKVECARAAREHACVHSRTR